MSVTVAVFPVIKTKTNMSKKTFDISRFFGNTQKRVDIGSLDFFPWELK